MLRRRVGRAVREADQAADRGQVHDRAPAGAAHAPRGGLTPVEEAVQVHVDHRAPLIRRDLEHVPDLPGAGAVHEDVDPAGLGADRRRRRIHGRRIADVARERERPVGARGGEFLDDGLARIGTEVEPGDPCALGREHPGDLPSDAASGAGDDRDATFEQHAPYRMDADGSDRRLR